MRQWSITLYGPSGVVSAVDTGESQFVIGTETGGDVFTVAGAGVMPRHAWAWISGSGMQVEDLGGGTLVNGHAITERVQVEYPASVQVGDLTLVVEVKAAPTLQKEQVAEAPARSGISSSDSAPLQGEYKLVREIARGGMGKIYFGEDPQLKRNVAVKVSSVSEGGEDPRFAKEAEVLAQLAHPNIVPIHTIGVDSQKRPFYSMKLVKGRTLQAVLNAIRDGDSAAIKEYPRATLLTIFRKVCDAMMFAHSKGILHRDLKPENIMVGEYGEVLVMDWGLAKVLGEREDHRSSTSRVNDTGDYGMTMEGEVMGTPQYMSPEQAEGMVAELDQRSDIYSLGGILYAILMLRAPIEGTTLDEVLTRVKSGKISSMVTKRGSKSVLTVNAPSAMGGEVPEALQAVTLKAMSTDRSRRYPSVEAFAGDIERYQNGFATSAENAGAFKRMKLWVGRNKVLASSAAVLVFVVSGFTLRVIQKGHEAGEALLRLRETAPTFAVRTRQALGDGDFSEALKSIDFAIDLESNNSEYHALRGNVLQVLVRWPEASESYQRSLRLGELEGVKANLQLTEDLIARAKKYGEAKAKGDLFEALNAQGRQYEAMAFGKELGDFWRDRKKDLSVIPELVKRLETKLLPVPGTSIVLSKTEFTVGEWKLYLKAEGLPEWKQPSQDFQESDEHPVVMVTWHEAKKFCEWLSKVTGKEWRLPTNLEWEAAAGTTKYYWGDYFPPKWDDGNYAVADNGRGDPNTVGVDGIKGTAPVGSFKANVLGFYDLGGNACEWMWDFDKKTGTSAVRGGSWRNAERHCVVATISNNASASRFNDLGFRVARSSVP